MVPMRALFVSTVMVGLSAAIGPAGAEQLNGKRIANLVAGKTVYLATPYGFEFPLVYRTDGTVTGDGTGTLLSRFFAPTETGRWWVGNSRLCQKWPSWYRGRTLCFRIKQTGPKSLDWVRDDGYSGSARIRG